ncbi:hypothetical protein Aeqsu_3161 [Aequorivita sublithincola DSM 14238]|uniref:Uncharacterized protein n=1 Tax=Aequorivita sublithincola (strain DSM 14238 / LMG 21431 / ACAM 643 / 9-3) TaxID=746697 RepID=I3Z027_AEQSU|nr:DUF6326 family protein [Aequorivita sublithincola]AFL82595.1 hypothetical protein Aeqsu_3161 [Aequorivita sublithincola DSM 14238]
MKTSTDKSNASIDFQINIKIKLAGLWTATTLCYLYGDYFQLYIPGQVESLISGENALNSPLKLFIASIILAIPPIMIFLSLVLKPRLNRILNIILGSIFTIMMVSIAINSLTPWYAFYVFLAIVEAILTFKIVWKAFKWPR